MAALTHSIIKLYRYLNEEIAATPWPGLAILAFYLYFILDLGPKLMANRQPFKLERIMQIYDVVQIVACAFIGYKALTLAWLRDYSFACHPLDESRDPIPMEIARMVWVYFLVKLLDLLDTIFFVLRKKQGHLTFLHIYHHTGMVMAGWAAVKWIPGGHVTLLGLINSWVHVVMYTHYLVMSLKIWKPWWKKYITQLQLAQFTVLLYQYLLLVLRENCAFPRWPAAIFIPQNLFMTILFCEFYYKTYIKKPQKKNEKNGTAKEVSNGLAKGKTS